MNVVIRTSLYHSGQATHSKCGTEVSAVNEILTVIVMAAHTLAVC